MNRSKVDDGFSSRTNTVGYFGLASFRCLCVLGAVVGLPATGFSETAPNHSIQVAQLSETPARAGEPRGISLKLSTWMPLKPLDLTTQTENIWDDLPRGFTIPDLNTKRVMFHERALIRSKRALQNTLKAARPYIHYIAQECIRRGLPTELALLPFVESQFNPHALSRAKASGLWQFIPSTGKHYQLRQNRWMDERKDPIESTRAALDYLTYLYELKGDWHLALISYNWGPGAVNRAIAKARAKGLSPTLENLKLPEETRNYVPKLQAFKNIVSSPEKFGVHLPHIDNEPYFTVFRRDRDLDFRELARLARIDLRDLRKLNPALHQPVMFAAQTKRFLVPRRYEGRVRAALTRYQPPKRYKVYTVRPGDTLGRIATRFRVQVADIQALNSLGRSTLIKPGMSLTLPKPIAGKGWPV